jgi:hypothetical protein
MNGGVERFPRIAVLSYDMGAEGITFGTHTFPYWHLTHLLFFGNTTSARTAQIINRLSGNHGDNHPLIAMVSNSNKRKSIKEFISHDEWVEEICGLKQKGNFQISKYLIEKEHFEGRIPKKFISLKGSKGLLKECFNPNLKEEQKAFHKAYASEICYVFNRVKFEKDYKEITSDIQKECDLMLINNSGLAPRHSQVYNATIITILEENNAEKWISRTATFVKSVCRHLDMSTQGVKACLKNFGLKSNLHERVNDETISGLLLKKVNNRWKIRLNS